MHLRIKEHEKSMAHSAEACISPRTGEEEAPGFGASSGGCAGRWIVRLYTSWMMIVLTTAIFLELIILLGKYDVCMEESQQCD